jgi:hypothetical protein
MMDFVVQVEESGIWDVLGDGQLVIAYNRLDNVTFRKARMVMVFLPPETDSIPVEYMGGRSEYVMTQRQRNPVYLLLNSPTHIGDEVARLKDMGLNWFEVGHPMVGYKWTPTVQILSSPNYYVHAAVSFDTTALMTLKLLMMDD